VADVLLVESNPLEDLGALEQIDRLMTRRVWYDRARLDSMLDEVAEKRAGKSQ
jgi:hypothetical protein